MPQTLSIRVADLKLDLHNYRIPPTTTEIESVHALIALKSHYFWDLTRSLLDEGYDGLENIIVLKTSGEHIVREGNRRIGAMKIILGLLPRTKFDLPDDIVRAIDSLSLTWQTENDSVPCLVYDQADAALVDQKVQRTHGRGETAGRLKWEALARARYERDVEKRSYPALDMLDKYLAHARKITPEVRERWGGVFPLTVLREAMQKVAVRYKLGSSADLLTEMENNTQLAKILGRIVHDVGLEKIETRHVRLSSWGSEYGLPPPPSPPTPNANPPSATTSQTQSTQSAIALSQSAAPGATTSPAAITARSRKHQKALPLSDPRSLKRKLNLFTPTGSASSKVVDLLFEMKKLRVGETPICFVLLLRSMFDISVSAYCSRHRLPTVKVTSRGARKEKSLGELLVDACKDLQSKTTDRATISDLRTAAAEINAANGLLAIPAMNGLVHSGTSIITEAQVLAGFHKIFPLLVELNK